MSTKPRETDQITVFSIFKPKTKILHHHYLLRGQQIGGLDSHYADCNARPAC